MAGARVVLVLAAAGILVGLSVSWADLGPVGFTAIAPVPDGPLWEALGDDRRTGWEALGVLVVLPAAAVAALLACTVRPSWTALRAGALVLLAAGAVVCWSAAASPGEVRLRSLAVGVDVPPVATLERTWGADLTLVLLALGAAGVLLRATPGRTLLATGAVLLAGSLLLPWEWRLADQGAVADGRGPGFLGPWTVALVAVAAVAAAAALRPRRSLLLLALVAAGTTIAGVVVEGFEGAVDTGPFVALLAALLAATGAVGELARVQDARLAGVCGAGVLAVTPFVPWGPAEGFYFGPAVGSEGSWTSTGFPTAFDVAGGPGPVLWLAGAAAVLVAVLARRRRVSAVLAALAVVVLVGVATVLDEAEWRRGLVAAALGSGLALVGTVAAALPGSDGPWQGRLRHLRAPA